MRPTCARTKAVEKVETIANSLKREKPTSNEIAEDSGASVNFVFEIHCGLTKDL